MNYFWKNLDKKGQEEIGFIGNYNIMTSKEGKVFAYVNIYYLPLNTCKYLKIGETLIPKEK